jgi:hypothetical protein
MGEENLRRDGVYYLEEKIKLGALLILSANSGINSTALNSNRRARGGHKSSLLLGILEEGMEAESDCPVIRARGSFAGHLS